MKVKLIRLFDNGDTTVGALYIDGIMNCFIVEDQENTNKVYGETRIPCGIYDLGLRTEGMFHSRYLKKFGATFHKGMICIFNASNWRIVTPSMSFQYVLFHIGNTDDDSAGCLLTNNQVSMSGIGADSTGAYTKFYPIVCGALLRGEKVTLEIIDAEEGK